MATEGPRITVSFRRELTLPLRTGSICFAVVTKSGLTSHSWKVFTRKGDAYVVCRETMKEVKVSLHQSGRQHIAFIKGSGHEMTPGSRFWNRSWEQARSRHSRHATFRCSVALPVRAPVNASPVASQRPAHDSG